MAAKPHVIHSQKYSPQLVTQLAEKYPDALTTDTDKEGLYLIWFGDMEDTSIVPEVIECNALQIAEAVQILDAWFSYSNKNGDSNHGNSLM